MPPESKNDLDCHLGDARAGRLIEADRAKNRPLKCLKKCYMALKTHLFNIKTIYLYPWLYVKVCVSMSLNDICMFIYGLHIDNILRSSAHTSLFGCAHAFYYSHSQEYIYA